MVVIEKLSFLLVSQEKLAQFEDHLAKEKIRLLDKRKNERKQKRKMEAAAAKQAEKDKLGTCRQWSTVYTPPLLKWREDIYQLAVSMHLSGKVNLVHHDFAVVR